MKIRTTKKSIKEAFPHIIGIGYCNAYYLLQGIEPDFYTCGVYGWNEDVYKIDYNIAIATGYRPSYNIQANYDITKKYNEKARKIYNNYDIDYKIRINKITKLREKFICEIIKGVK